MASIQDDDAPQVKRDVNEVVAAAITLDEIVRREHSLGFVAAVKLYPAAVAWSMFVSIGVVMLAFDPQLLGNFFAMPQFQKDFGYLYDGEVSYPFCSV